MKKSIATIFFLYAVMALSAQPITTLRINPDNAMGGKASQIFDRINYIPLETTKESLFGKIDKLAVTDKYYIVLDHQTDAILFFRKNGKFDHKITKFPVTKNKFIRITLGNGQEAGVISHFRINTFNLNQLIIQSDYDMDSLYCVSFDGVLIKKIARPLQSNDFIFLNGGIGIYAQNRPFKNFHIASYKPYDITILSEKSGKVLKRLLPIDLKSSAGQDEIVGRSHFCYSGDSNTAFFVRNYDYTISELDSSGIKRQYKLIFPLKYSLPNNFAYDSVYKYKRFDFLKDKRLIENIGFFYKINNCLFFSAPAAKFVGNDSRLFYSLSTGNTLSFNRILSDSLSNYLPVFNNAAHIMSCDGKNIYAELSSLAMFEAKEASQSKLPQYPPVLQRYFSTQSRKSNPVIVQLKPKENL